MAYSDVGYTIWFAVTTLFVIAILVVGMIMATGGRPRRDREGPSSDAKKPPP